MFWRVSLESGIQAKLYERLGTVRDERLRERVKEAIEELEAAKALQEVPGVRRLRGGEGYYRMRVGDYRLGFVLEGEKVVLVRFLHRREVYRYFP